MTCNASQSDFLAPVIVRPDKAIKKVNYTLTYKFGEGFFDSCKVGRYYSVLLLFFHLLCFKLRLSLPRLFFVPTANFDLQGAL